MRSGEEIRDALVNDARHAVTRPAMHAQEGRALERLVGSLLAYAAFADETDLGLLDRHRRYGEEGITGPFRALLGRDEPLVHEVAAVMALELHRAGYLEVGPVLDRARFEQVRSEIRDRFDEVDLLASQIEGELGEPTFRVDDRAWAYGSEDLEAGWIFLSFWEGNRTSYVPGSGTWTYERDANRLLRFVWTSEGPFEDSFALSLRTKLEVWGSGWGWNHSWRSAGAPPGVREQLQANHDADPSKRLRSPQFGDVP